MQGCISLCAPDVLGLDVWVRLTVSKRVCCRELKRVHLILLALAELAMLTVLLKGAEHRVLPIALVLIQGCFLDM